MRRDRVLNGLRYHVDDDAPRRHSSAAPLLLLHGFTGALSNWNAIVTGLRTRGVAQRIVRVDLPGHGLTEPSDAVARHTMPAIAADLAALLDALELSAVHVLGYSMGGRLALYVAVHHASRVQSVVLESASPGLEQEYERTVRRASDSALAERILTHGIPEFVDEWDALPLWRTQPAALRSQLHNQRLRNRAQGLALSLHGMGTGAQPSLWNALATLPCPALCLAGEHDTKFVAIAHQMQQRNAALNVQIVAGAGHAVHQEQPEAYCELVGTWLESAG